LERAPVVNVRILSVSRSVHYRGNVKSRTAIALLCLSASLNLLPALWMVLLYFEGKTGAEISAVSWFYLVTIPFAIVAVPLGVVFEVVARIRGRRKH
jgi:hypothetical protein